MILQVGTDRRPRDNDRQTELFQKFGIADAGQLQQLRALVRASRQENLAPRTDQEFLPTTSECNALDDSGLDRQPLRECVGEDREIRT